MGGGVESISKNRPSHHKYKFPNQHLLTAYLNTSGLNGSKRNLCELGATFSSRFLRRKSNVSDKFGRAKNCIKETNRINICCKLLLRAIYKDYLKSAC